MTTTTLTKASLRLVLGCSVALFFAANVDAASAHGGGHSSGGSDRSSSDHSDHHDHDYYHHDHYYHHDRHHHHHRGVGPISGGNPPKYHPPVVKIPVSGVTKSHLPVKPCVGECAPARLCNGLPCHRGGG